MPIALYLISQLGPSNELIFKRKQIEDSTVTPQVEVGYQSPGSIELINNQKKNTHIVDPVTSRISSNELIRSKTHTQNKFTRTKIDFIQWQKLPQQHKNGIFKRKESSVSTQSNANYIKFYIYKNLQNIIAEINRINQEQPVFERQ